MTRCSEVAESRAVAQMVSDAKWDLKAIKTDIEALASSAVGPSSGVVDPSLSRISNLAESLHLLEIRLYNLGFRL
jgi:hypothetical protein